MARRRSNPPLYELIKSGDGGPQRPSPLPARQAPGDGGGGALHALRGLRLSPGRAVTLPVGYLLLAAALVVVVGVGAWVGGYQLAEQRARAHYEQQLLSQTGPLDGDLPRDPLLAADEMPGGPLLDRSSGRAPAVSPATTSDPRGWGPVRSDPRRAGHRYFVLIETNPDGADRLAEYCRGHGLESYVVVSHNNRSRRLVIALPGFPEGTSSQDQQFRALRERIHAIGTRWKQERRGATDLHDAYPLMFRP